MTLVRPSPPQARLLRALSERPDDCLRVWFSSVRYMARTELAKEGIWPRGAVEEANASRQTVMSCVRLGWIKNLKVFPNPAGVIGGEAAFYGLSDAGAEAIRLLSPEAFISLAGPKKPSVRGESARILRALAARHDREKGWIFLAEAPIDGTNVDAWAINCFASQGHRRVGYEVKVSRSDFTSELRQPAKTARSARFASEFYFACPNGLIKPAEVPDPYGLVYVKPNGRSRMVKRSKLPKTEPTWGLVGRLMRRLAQMEEGAEP